MDNKNVKEMKNKIVDELIDLNIVVHGQSIEMWTDILLQEYLGKFDSVSMMDKYEYLAKKYNTIPSRIERILRHGKDQMKKRVREKYNITTKICNETIVILFKLKIF